MGGHIVNEVVYIYEDIVVEVGGNPKATKFTWK